MISRPLSFFFITALGLTVARAESSVTLQIVPAAPVEGEPVYVIYSFPESCGSWVDWSQIDMRQEANRISVTFSLFEDRLGCDGPIRRVVELGQFPKGSYSVTAGFGVYPSLPLSISAAETWASAAFDVVAHVNGRGSINNVSGFWSAARDPGWSVAIFQQPDRDLLVSWMTYDETGRSEWYFLLPGLWTQTNVYEAEIVSVDNGPYFGRQDVPSGGLSPDPPTITVVGRATLGFGLDSPVGAFASFSYTVRGVASTRLLHKLAY
jgi:hypothetical protein